MFPNKNKNNKKITTNVNGKMRYIKNICIGFNGNAYKLIGMKNENIDGRKTRVAILGNMNDERNATAEEMLEFSQNDFIIIKK